MILRTFGLQLIYIVMGLNWTSVQNNCITGGKHTYIQNETVEKNVCDMVSPNRQGHIVTEYGRS